MPFRLKRKEPVGAGIKRLAAEQIDEASGQLTRQENVEEAIHEARKNVKKTRALLRLVGYGDEDRRLRNVGRALSEIRDAAAMIEVFDAVLEKYQPGVKKESLAGIRRGLEESKHSADAEKAIASALAGLDTIRGRVKDWPIEGDEFRTLAAGLEASYRAGRKALDRAEKNGTAKQYHEFRKRAKEHWYHMRLIESWCTEPLKSRTASLKDLETWLGEHHNLAVLEEKLAIEPGIQLFLALAANEQRELERNSISLGQRLYEQKPKQFVRGLSKLFEVETPRKRPARANQTAIARERPA